LIKTRYKLVSINVPCNKFMWKILRVVWTYSGVYVVVKLFSSWKLGNKLEVQWRIFVFSFNFNRVLVGSYVAKTGRNARPSQNTIQGRHEKKNEKLRKYPHYCGILEWCRKKVKRLFHLFWNYILSLAFTFVRLLFLYEKRKYLIDGTIFRLIYIFIFKSIPGCVELN